MRIQKTCALAMVLAGLFVGTVQAAVPEGKVAIHYNRCDGNYEGWGLHTWKNPGIPLPGVEWANPLQPTAKDDFGVLWQTDFAEYGKSGAVNYIIHKGDTKEQGGKDMKFEGKEHKEIWVNSGDRKMYYSLDDARKARAEKPCE
jgi:hypothetical protein